MVMIGNGLVDTDYVEPYAGGASVALSLVFEDFANHAFINDLNRGVYAFWSSALHQTEQLCARIADTPLTMDTWWEQKAVLSNQDATALERGFATLFLNRTNRSGILAGGVIGGKNQTGEWKLDARFNRDDLIRRIQKVGRFRTRISISNLDAAQFLIPWTGEDASDAFLYLDPPYFVKGAGLYDNSYELADHQRIAAMVRRLKHPWLVSYDAAPEIFGLYKWARTSRYDLNYSASAPSRGFEVMFRRAALWIPDPEVTRPAAVKPGDVDRLRVEVFAASSVRERPC
jgi:DNA adenine methylase